MATSSWLRWLLGALYLALCFLLFAIMPSWLQWPLAVIYLVYTAHSFITFEMAVSIADDLRPLTNWDLPDAPDLIRQLNEAARKAGLRRPPIWAVAEMEEQNAVAIYGPRSLVVFSSSLLHNLPADRLLAVAGHELAHLANRDALPALLGGSWLSLLGILSAQCHRLATMVGGFLGAIAGLLAVVVDLTLMLVGWLGETFLAKRSRMAEHLADLAGARLTSASAMIAVLERLAEARPNRQPDAPRWTPGWIAQKLHASHPPTDERIAFLRQAAERGEIHV